MKALSDAAAAGAEGGAKSSRAFESISASTTLAKFTYDEIKAATGNFSRENIIGRGGYGNVYRGQLADGRMVALKRFRNCAAAGDEAFAHEVEVIASVRHVNLVALYGYCIATTLREGHQRIIVSELVEHGSLYDHLFAEGECRLPWPARQRIAIGTARGLAYLHHGAEPKIIHRDIKASNILLDDELEAKVCDFGLARYAPEGETHISTRAAGTHGYLAPEYAIYGQLSEKIDVYSFGVVLLELLSGKRAFVPLGEGQSFVITDWARTLVGNGRTMEVIQEGMADLGQREVMENYVVVAVLCTHPQPQARPTMDTVVKMLEVDVASVPSFSEPAIMDVAADEVERLESDSDGNGGNASSGQLFTGVHDGNRDDTEGS